ncbi:large conductance mechanosensitive channel protein MscL [Mycoplasmopsis lipofaciens]|uniref:large conductance mechanosensitive channel protein MscL n=1 Tax=Mycoplasmopsis lipofaciens TaxID=114884 RepID=UPI00048727B4|nr:MscL family protein [Mycoplasmopsis lipofaciens]
MIKQARKDAWSVVKRGNMFMLAIGLLLGAAFNEVVKSFANDIIMAAIANAFGKSSVEGLSAYGILYGKFLAALISFIIVALFIFVGLWVVFIFVNMHKQRKLRKNPPKLEEPAKPTNEELILDELKKLNEQLSQLNKK